jgi:beta-aspartyl-peptidase (threonine type)
MHNKPAIIVHGGAGAWDEAPERLRAGKLACEAAAKAGQQLLLEGGSALDAVEVAVRILEDCPALDAGRGSYPNARGEIEMDALIMDGRTLAFGAVAAVQRVRYPISLARELLEQEGANFLVGPGAGLFADSIGFPRCELAELLVSPDAWNIPAAGQAGNTVGAVALDNFGNLAAATSTGGTRAKLPGRVGDSPLVGSGAYADNLGGAASATGRGEDLIKIVICKQVCDFVTAGLAAKDACRAAVQLLERRVRGSGGVIAVDGNGRVGFAYNTFAMPYAYAIGESPTVVGQ